MIDRFTGEHAFLSNFFPAKVDLEGVTFPTVEHAYQAAKTDDPNERESIRIVSAPGVAKRLGRHVTQKANWGQMRLSTMEGLLRQKFADSELREFLLATGGEELVEGNWWGDQFWGVCNGQGENNLGKLLMKIREELR